MVLNLKQMTHTQTHPLHNLNAHFDPQINQATFKCKKILLGAGASKNFNGSGSRLHNSRLQLSSPDYNETNVTDNPGAKKLIADCVLK